MYGVMTTLIPLSLFPHSAREVSGRKAMMRVKWLPAVPDSAAAVKIITLAGEPPFCQVFGGHLVREPQAP